MGKRCAKCGISKDVTLFHHNKNTFDGLYPWCKVCSNENRKKVYWEKEKQNPTYRDRKRQHEIASVARHPEKRKARQLAKDAGLRKDNCERCDADTDLHMHHEDYSKPLEVITLCRTCHETAHHGVIV